MMMAVVVMMMMMMMRMMISDDDDDDDDDGNDDDGDDDDDDDDDDDGGGDLGGGDALDGGDLDGGGDAKLDDFNALRLERPVCESESARVMWRCVKRFRQWSAVPQQSDTQSPDGSAGGASVFPSSTDQPRILKVAGVAESHPGTFLLHVHASWLISP